MCDCPDCPERVGYWCDKCQRQVYPHEVTTHDCAKELARGIDEALAKDGLTTRARSAK